MLTKWFDHGVAVPHTLMVIVGFVGSLDVKVIVALSGPGATGLVTVTVYDALEPPATLVPVVGAIVNVALVGAVIDGGPSVNVCAFVAFAMVIVAV